jgi:signal transduction histidine kinase
LEAANKELNLSATRFRTICAPLRAVDGFSRILMEDYAQLPADAVRYLQLVRNNAQQMGELIEVAGFLASGAVGGE